MSNVGVLFPRRIKAYANPSSEVLTGVAALTKDDWGDGKNKCVKAFKDAVRSELRRLQHNRCAYCGHSFENESDEVCHIDHIAPKSLHGEWTFEPRNLVLACRSCNKSGCKGAKEVIVSPKKKDCTNCDYIIVHPFLDEFNDYIDWAPGSAPMPRLETNNAMKKKARKTIDMFNLLDDNKIRRRNLSLLPFYLDQPDILEAILVAQPEGLPE